MAGLNLNLLKNGAVIGAATYMGLKAYKAGCMEFEKLVPRAIEKVTIMRLTGGLLRGSNDEEEDEYEDD